MINKIASSAVEYQGISIIKKENKRLEKILHQYYSKEKLKLRPNLHVCLDYFGMRKQSDKHVMKEQEFFNDKTLGIQVTVKVIGIGYYKQVNEHGEDELMNVSLLIDDSTFDAVKIEDRFLNSYNRKNMPWITLWTNSKTVQIEDKTYPIATAKHSGKCFGLENLNENEQCSYELWDEPIVLTGELCLFKGSFKYYHVEHDTTRLITWKNIREDQDVLLNAAFEKENVQTTADKLHNQLFS